MKAQASSLPFTPVLAAMAAIVNTKLPQVGELLYVLFRLILLLFQEDKRSFSSVDHILATSDTLEALADDS